MNEKNEIALTEGSALPSTPASGSLYNSIAAFQDGQRIAGALAASSLVPQDYRGNVANTLVALEMSQRTGSSPMAVMQNMHVIHGRPSWSSQFVIAALNSCGRFSPLRFRVTGTGDDETCVAWAYDKASGDELEGPPVSIGMAKAEGWYGKNGSKWKTMPQLMLRYRAAKFFGNLYAPDILMGMHASDEVEDIKGPAPARSADDGFTPPPANDNALQGGGADALNAAAMTTPAPKPEPDDEPRVAARLTYWINRETGEFRTIKKGESIPEDGETVSKSNFEEFCATDEPPVQEGEVMPPEDPETAEEAEPAAEGEGGIDLF